MMTGVILCREVVLFFWWGSGSRAGKLPVVLQVSATLQKGKSLRAGDRGEESGTKEDGRESRVEEDKIKHIVIKCGNSYLNDI